MRQQIERLLLLCTLLWSIASSAVAQSALAIREPARHEDIDVEPATPAVPSEPSEPGEPWAPEASVEVTADYEPTLSPIVLGASLKLDLAGDAVVLPVVEGQWDEYVVGSAQGAGSVRWQGRIAIKPEPPAGESSDVARLIRSINGVAEVGTGIVMAYYVAKSGALGGYLRLGGELAYQSADTLEETDTSGSELEASRFGIGSGSAAAGLYLRYVYVGYEVRLLGVFGKNVSDDLKDDVQDGVVHRGQVVIPVTIESADSGSEKTLYAAFGYAPKEEIFSVAVTASFDPF